MIGDAFDYSEKYNTPVIFRPTTRVCHASASINLDETRRKIEPEGFVKDSKWVIFPRLSYQNHKNIENRNKTIADDFSSYNYNKVSGSGKMGIVSGGISYAYTKEALSLLKGSCRLMRVATPYPFPEKQAVEFLKGLDEVLVIEELSPYIEKELIYLCGKYQLPVKVKGKLTDDLPCAGENTVEIVMEAVSKFLDIDYKPEKTEMNIELPSRPPVLCAGCPHRASFYAVKQAMKGKKAVFSGDIGCYTLGNAKPLDMVDTCLCMGADVTMAQGIHRVDPGTVNFAFIGDSTFFHTGIPGVINAVYNETDIVLIVLDNSTTAMTGNQPHPGTGKTMMGNISEKVSIYNILKAIGVKYIARVNPFDLAGAEKAVAEAAAVKGVSAVIFEAPCIQVSKPAPLYQVDNEKCIGCKVCIKELGCPSMSMENEKAFISPSTCYGCSICAQVCPFDAIGGAR
jgi:indolepyruvate ferredoxin oxidoreductase alpha subunit